MAIQRSFLWSFTDRNPAIPSIERCLMGIRRSDFAIDGRPFLSIPFLRSLANRNPTIVFCDRWPIRIQRSSLTIVGRSVFTTLFFRSLADRNPTISFLRSLADRHPTSLLRLLADRFWLSLFYERWPSGIQRSLVTIGQSFVSSLFCDRGPIFVNDPFFAIVGQSESNDPFLRSLADRF